MRILFINGDTAAEFVKSGMDKHYIVDVAYSGEDGIYLSQVNEYSAIIIESGTPDITGYEVCRQTRMVNNDIPILMLLDPGDISLRISALDCGADVILTKPLNIEELNAYMRSLVKRISKTERAVPLEAGNIKLNPDTKEVFKNDRKIKVRRKEYDILEYLLLNKGRIVTKEMILENAWEAGIEVCSNTLEVHMRTLREKIDGGKGRCSIIKTVYGIGYKIEAT